MTDNLII